MPLSLTPQQVRALREGVRMKQRDVAHETGYSASTVKSWERQGKAHRGMSRDAETAFRKLIEAKHAEIRADYQIFDTYLAQAA